jgi:hypothetical protein
MLAHHQADKVRDRSGLDHEGAVHIGFAEPEFGIEQHGPLRRGGHETDRERRPGAVPERIGHAACAGDHQIAATDMRKC